jgi:CO/xanthine dehydrogenase Mo-binding subunit
VQLTILKAGTEREIDAAFATLVQLQAGALVVGADAFFNSRREQLVALASRHAIPAIYEWREFPERTGWEPRPSPARPQRRYIGGARLASAQRSGAVGAIVAEVEVDRRSGKVRARKFTVAHDCGVIINSDGLRRCIEGNVV